MWSSVRRLIETTCYHPYFDFVLAAHESYRVEAEVVTEVDDRTVRVSDGRYGNQHHFVPVLGALVALAFAIGDEACDVAVLVAVVGTVISGVERTDVVCELVLFKECVHLVLVYHQQCLRGTEFVIGVVAVVIAVEDNLGSIDAVIVGHDFVNGEGYLGEDTCRSLQVGTCVVVDEWLQGLLFGAETVGLQYLFGAGKLGVAN